MAQHLLSTLEESINCMGTGVFGTSGFKLQALSDLYVAQQTTTQVLTLHEFTSTLLILITLIIKGKNKFTDNNTQETKDRVFHALHFVHLKDNHILETFYHFS